MMTKPLSLGIALLVACASYAQTPERAQPRSRSFSNGPDPVVVLDSISTMIKAHPDSVELYRTRAEKIYRYTLRRGEGTGDKYRRDGVFSDMDKAISLRPSDPSLVVARGDYRWEILQDTTAALADMGKALEIDPKNPRTLEARGTLYVKMGDYQKACADFTMGASFGDARCRESMTTFCPRK